MAWGVKHLRQSDELLQVSFRGCALDRRQLTRIEEIVGSGLNRTRQDLARAVCRAFRWRRPNGTWAVRSARGLLVRLEEAGVVRLPAPRRAQGRPRREEVETAAAVLCPAGVPTTAEPSARQGSGSTLVVRPVRADEVLGWRAHLERFHYLGDAALVGESLRARRPGARGGATRPCTCGPASPMEDDMTTIYFTEHDSPLGPLRLESDGQALTRIVLPGESPGPAPTGERLLDPGRFTAARAQLDQYFAGRRREFDLPLAPRGTPFQLRVWQALRTIPWGQTISYAELARRIGQPSACRAVGGANGRNPLSIVVPCHRVIGADGSLTGFGGGLAAKQRLLALEGVTTVR